MPRTAMMTPITNEPACRTISYSPCLRLRIITRQTYVVLFGAVLVNRGLETICYLVETNSAAGADVKESAAITKLHAPLLML